MKRKNNALFEDAMNQSDEDRIKSSIGTSANRPLDKKPSDRDPKKVADHTDYFDPEAGPLGGFRGYTDLNENSSPSEKE